MALHQEHNPIHALVTAACGEGVWGRTFSLDYFKDIGNEAKMSTSLQKYMSPDFPSI